MIRVCVPLLICAVKSVEQVKAAVTDKMQTVFHFGLIQAELMAVFADPMVQGIDPMVTLDTTLHFDPNWGGVNLLTDLSRAVVVQ